MAGSWTGGWCPGAGRSEAQKKPLRLAASNGGAHRAGLLQWALKPGQVRALELKPEGRSEFQLARIGVQAVFAEQAGF